MTIEHGLDQLAESIKSRIDRLEKNAIAWVEDALGLCIELAQARARFADNVGFGHWFDAQGLRLNRDDRAAAIAMGRDPRLARDVLTTTSSRSLQRIWRYEFSLRSATKTPQDELPLPTTGQPPAAKPKPVSPLRQRGLAAYDRIKEAGEPLTWVAVGKEAGVSNTVARWVFATRETEAKLAAEAEPAATTAAESAERFKLIEQLKADMMAHLSRMSAAERKRHDALAAGFKRELEDRIAAEVKYNTRKWQEETGIAFFMERVGQMERLFTEWPYSVMRKAEYNTVMRCLHPDTAHSRTAEERGEAFRLFTHYKLKMIDDEEERTAARRELRANMPKTLTEMLARKKTKTV